MVDCLRGDRMATFLKRGNSLKKEIKKKIRRDDKIFLTNIGVLILSIVIAVRIESIIPVIGWFIYRQLIDKKWKKAMKDVEIARAGQRGEELTENIIATLPDSFIVFSDVTIKSEEKESQIDHIVISPNGVFIIETKYWSGDIIPSEQDDRVTQVTKFGEKRDVYHPSRQVGTHVYRLANVLKKAHIKTWVSGCVYFSNEDVHVFVEHDQYPLFSRPGAFLSYLKERKPKNNRLNEGQLKAITTIIKKNIK